MMLRSMSLPLAACLLLGGVTVGCEDDEGSEAMGSLLVVWGGGICSTDGVTRLALSLSGPEEEPMVRSPACSIREQRFDDLVGGSYTLAVEYVGDGDAGVLSVAAGEAAAQSQTFEVHIEAGIEAFVRLAPDVLEFTPDGGMEPDAAIVLPPPPPPPTDSDEDGIPDSLDNCPDVFNPDQRNPDFYRPSGSPGDAAGNACDCNPTNPDLTETVLDDALDADDGQFTVLDGSWSFFGGVYRQSATDDLARSWRPLDDIRTVSVETEISIAGTGATGTIGFSFVGVALRATGMGPAAGLAYVCGINGSTLLIGILDVSLGTISSLESQVLPFTPTSSVPLSGWMKGDVIVCSAADAGGEWYEVTATDDRLSTGATGFITNGLAADFAFARVCGPPSQ